MKDQSPVIVSQETTRLSINFLGIVAGMLMIMLPFLGPWWIARVGEGAMEIALSPFDISITLLGQPIQSDLVDLGLLATKIAMIVTGVLLIIGSLSSRSWWSKHLVRLGVMKPFWAVVGLIVLLVISAILINNVLHHVISNFVEVSGVTMEFQVPYIIGRSTTTIDVGGIATITAPIQLSLTTPFYAAIAVSVLGIAARIYHRRFKK